MPEISDLVYQILLRLTISLVVAVGVYFMFDLGRFSPTILILSGLVYGYVFDLLLIRLME